MMLDKIRFYLGHSFNDLSVNKRLTFFALLSISAGVAAIVSLQTLGAMIGYTLDDNLQASNRGDIAVDVDDFGSDSDRLEAGAAAGVLKAEEISFFGSTTTDYLVSEQGIETLRSWAESRPYELDFTYRVRFNSAINTFFGGGVGASLTDSDSGQTVSQLTPVMIEANKYPFYGEILTIDGQSLDDVLNTPTDIVITEDIADTLGVQVGDSLLVSAATDPFTVAGIITDNAGITGFSDIFLGLFGYYYLDVASIEQFPEIDLNANAFYFQIGDPAQLEEVSAEFLTEFPYFSVETTDDLRETNEQITEQITQLITIMGLISLLIGSIGIINTMQVVVRRRMLEIAVLKTIGLQASQVTILFLSEAFILGIIGGILGIVLGWAAVFFIKGTAEAAFATEIPFRIAPAAAINGFIVGVAVTTVFGFLPTLTAGQIRPGIVLRPANNIVPRAGILRSILALILIIVVVSFIAQTILGSFALAFAVVIGAFVSAGILFLLLSLLIWIVGRFLPSFGIVDLKISLRQMLATRGRGALTLLALVIGVFSLSFITLFADSINNLLQISLESQGNLLISVQSYNQVDQVETILQEAEGVEDYIITLAYETEFVSWQSQANGGTYDRDGLQALLQEKSLEFPPFFQGSPQEKANIQERVLVNSFGQMQAVNVAEIPERNILAGRNITAEDASNTPVFVATDQEFWNQVGLQVGDVFTFEITGGNLISQTSEEVSFELVGIAEQSLDAGFSPASTYALESAFPEGVNPGIVQILVDVPDEYVNDLRVQLAEVPGIFAIETSIFTKLIENLLGTFIAFPTLVATLGLVVGGVVIANSVALTTMERRNEIAVMKSVGLQRNRVLSMILLENAILGLIGGLIGVGIGLVGLVIATAETGASEAVPYGTALLLMLLCIIVALIAAVSSAWTASGEKPLNVLRYE